MNILLLYDHCGLDDGDTEDLGRPRITPVGEGVHDVSYVPPPVGEPYKVHNWGYYLDLVQPKEIYGSEISSADASILCTALGGDYSKDSTIE